MFGRPASYRVELLCPSDLSQKRLQKLEKRLAFFLSDCGCHVAAFAFILIPVVLFYFLDYSIMPIWPNATVYFLITLAGTLLAKVGSLITTYYLALRAIEEILTALSTGRTNRI